MIEKENRFSENSCRFPSSRVFDAHVHLFPDKLFDAIWDWFNHHAWPIIRPTYSDNICRFLSERGILGMFGLCYAHRPGMSNELNQYMAELGKRYPFLYPFGTVFPGEPEQQAIVSRALFELGLVGIKLHCHVQQISPDSTAVLQICETLMKRDAILFIHAGQAPVLPEQREKILSLCSVERTAGLLSRFPQLKIVVPHLGMDEYDEYRDLLAQYPNLYLDTAMAIGGYFSGEPLVENLAGISERVLFGTDFPNLPYDYGDELDSLLGSKLSCYDLENLLWKNAMKLIGNFRTSQPRKESFVL